MGVWPITVAGNLVRLKVTLPDSTQMLDKGLADPGDLSPGWVALN
jgi:hypothetical protein